MGRSGELAGAAGDLLLRGGSEDHRAEEGQEPRVDDQLGASRGVSDDDPDRGGGHGAADRLRRLGAKGCLERGAVEHGIARRRLRHLLGFDEKIVRPGRLAGLSGRVDFVDNSAAGRREKVK